MEGSRSDCQERRQLTMKQMSPAFRLEALYDCELSTTGEKCDETHCLAKRVLFDLIGNALYSNSDRDSKVSALNHLKCDIELAASEIDKKIVELLKTSG